MGYLARAGAAPAADEAAPRATAPLPTPGVVANFPPQLRESGAPQLPGTLPKKTLHLAKIFIDKHSALVYCIQ